MDDTPRKKLDFSNHDDKSELVGRLVPFLREALASHLNASRAACMLASMHLESMRNADSEVTADILKVHDASFELGAASVIMEMMNGNLEMIQKPSPETDEKDLTTIELIEKEVCGEQDSKEKSE